MRSALDALKMKGFAWFPAVGLEAPVQVLGVVEGAAAFLVAYVEPEAGALPDLGRALVEVAEDALVVPPDAGRKYGQPAEKLRLAKAQEERNQAAE